MEINPNEDVEADEFTRPPVGGAVDDPMVPGGEAPGPDGAAIGRGHTGAPVELFPQRKAALQEALDSFMAQEEPPSHPGDYRRLGFRLPYQLESFSLVLGNLETRPRRMREFSCKTAKPGRSRSFCCGRL